MKPADEMFNITQRARVPYETEKEKYIENIIYNSAKDGKFSAEIEMGICVTNGIKPNHENESTITHDDINKLMNYGYEISYELNYNVAIISWSK